MANLRLKCLRRGCPNKSSFGKQFLCANGKEAGQKALWINQIKPPSLLAPSLEPRQSVTVEESHALTSLLAPSLEPRQSFKWLAH